MTRGLNADRLRRVFYFGDDDGKATAREYCLFQYSDGVGDDAGVVDDLHAADDPDSLAPRKGVELCALVIKEVVSFDAPGGRCTWVLGQAFSMARHLRRRYSKRVERIAECVHVVQHVVRMLLTRGTNSLVGTFSITYTHASTSSPTYGRRSESTTSSLRRSCAHCVTGTR